MKNKKNIGILVGMLVIFATISSVAGTMISNKTIKERFVDYFDSEQYIIDTCSDRIWENWIEEAKLTTSDVEAADYFDQSVSIDGDYAIIGAYSDDDQGVSPGLVDNIMRSIPSIIYVNADATGSNNGSSWIDAFTDLQDALAIAQVYDQVWVATGTYTPDSSSCDRNASFILADTVEIYDGFIGIEQTLEERAGLFEQTILSGDLLYNDQPELTNYEDNSNHVVLCLNIDQGIVLDGFTIKGGYANDTNSIYNGGGGGIYISYDSNEVSISNCYFKTNWATYRGGAVKSSGWGCRFHRCWFQNNYGGVGGAIYNGQNMSITCCVFAENHAYEGGAIITGDWPGLRLDNCLLFNNSADDYGGAVFVAYFGYLKISNCTFVNNHAGYVGDSLYAHVSNTYIENSIIWGGGEYLIAYAFEPPWITYSDVQGGWEYGENIIDDDPLFVDPLNSNFHLWRSSPCIDAGDPVVQYSQTHLDIDGDPRVWDGDGDGIARIDMGADEYFYPYDVNFDGVVDTLDYGLVMAAFGCDPSDPAYAPYDVNADGVINTIDCGLVEAAYGPCP